MDVDFDRYRALEIIRDGPILRVWFNRPEQLNAISREVHGELHTLFTDIERDDETQIAVLSGRGRAFSAGGDLDWLLELNADPAASARAIKADRDIQTTMLQMEKPVLARVNGPAVGLGCSLALYCDVVVAVPTAVFSDPHVSIGLVAGDGGAVLWPQLLGYMRARRYLLTGDPITGEVAEELGLITETAAPDELNQRIDQWAERLLRQPQHALRWTKYSINAGLRATATAVLDVAAALENVTQIMPAHAAAIRALKDTGRAKPTITGRVGHDDDG